jgi:hypothetical protein
MIEYSYIAWLHGTTTRFEVICGPVLPRKPMNLIQQAQSSNSLSLAANSYSIGSTLVAKSSNPGRNGIKDLIIHKCKPV